MKNTLISQRWVGFTARVIAGLLIAVLGVVLLMGKSTIDIHIYDTWYVLPDWSMIILFLPAGIFLTYLPRILTGSALSPFARKTFIITGFLSVIMLTFLVKYISSSFGWTIYPPLSALSNESVYPGSSGNENPNTGFLIIIQAFILLMFTLGISRSARRKTDISSES